MRKKDRAGENIVCLLDDFRMIGENGLHILLLGVMLGQQSLGLRWGVTGWCKTRAREGGGGGRLAGEISGCPGEG